MPDEGQVKIIGGRPFIFRGGQWVPQNVGLVAKPTPTTVKLPEPKEPFPGQMPSLPPSGTLVPIGQLTGGPQLGPQLGPPKPDNFSLLQPDLSGIMRLWSLLKGNFFSSEPESSENVGLVAKPTPTTVKLPEPKEPFPGQMPSLPPSGLPPTPGNLKETPWDLKGNFFSSEPESSKDLPSGLPPLPPTDTKDTTNDPNAHDPNSPWKSDEEYESYYAKIDEAIANGRGYPPKMVRWGWVTNGKGQKAWGITEESAELLTYWNEAMALKTSRDTNKRTQANYEAEELRKTMGAGVTQTNYEAEQRQTQANLLEERRQAQANWEAEQRALTEKDQRAQAQVFLLQLLQNPGAMAAFQLQSLMGGRSGAFAGGEFGLPQGQLPGAAGRFGFSPYATASGANQNDIIRRYQGYVDSGLMNQQDADKMLAETLKGQSGALDTQRSTSQFQSIGAPLSNFFQGGVPTLGGLGEPNSPDLQGLMGMLSLFGINPQQFQQGSAMVTPRPISSGGGGYGGGPRLALAAGRR